MANLRSELSERLNMLAYKIEDGDPIGYDLESDAKWVRDLRLAAKACEALRNHRENLRGVTTTRKLAEELRLSMYELCRIIDDGRAYRRNGAGCYLHKEYK